MAIFQPKNPEQNKSLPIPMAEALELMTNYKNNRIPELKNSGNEDINGFYFDANDIIAAVSNLRSPKDKIFIAFAKHTDNSNVDDYTIIVSGVEYDEDENKNYYKYDAIYHPWYEYAKPCPDECPQER